MMPDVQHGLAEVRVATNEPTIADDVRNAALRHPVGRALKRTLDLIVSVPTAVVAACALPFLALAIRLDSPGPILFRQCRIGRDGREISVYKFRSMYVDAEQRLASDPALLEQYLTNGYKLPEGQDPRVTRVGRLLRKTSIDELPQVWCVVKGTMSLVGPRPVLPDELPDLFGELAPYYCAVKPGITGLWQVSGRSKVTSQERANLEATYVRTWSLWLDIKVLFKTVPTVIFGEGAH